MAPLTIEELSAQVGVTVRNIRAYQAQGLIDAPERSGRVALYDDAHVARLELVRDLREQGIGLPAIERLLRWGEGIDPRELRAFADTLMHGLLEESPLVLSPQDVSDVWGDQVTPELVQRSIATGFLRLEDDGRIVVMSPTLRAHGMQLAALGVSFEEAVSVLEQLNHHLDALAVVFADLFTRNVSGPALADGGGDRAAALAQVTAAVDTMRPWATSAVNAAFRLAMQRRAEEALAEILPDGDEPPPGP
ncbi:MerR family transcriptional regulator [Paraconexibacter algicola]|uniref:HTH merR-type domain-containing protein n=1 Tax=Paraconexibacter algicola TaxID=2133960 RepID=A0A2T4UK16_9ACTN|nr:MerR family transcriptional regulator [Paraconexibacter algicola]PTL59592.1 hypothetical protein C7Y72_07985 [Paraconexibacter algicola]